MRLEDNDIVLVQLDKNLELCDAKEIGEAIADAISSVGVECGMLIVGPGTDLSKIDEAYMNQFGWFKTKSGSELISELF